MSKDCQDAVSTPNKEVHGIVMVTFPWVRWVSENTRGKTVSIFCTKRNQGGFELRS